MFGKTQKDAPSDATLSSHKLLHKGGFIRESTAGRYYMLPLGIKVQQKIIDVIREEMDKSGAQELITPVLHPLELWQETNRTNTTGFELSVITDRRGAKFALGGTAEEMMVDLVRKFQISYKDLPFNIYQFSTKFRDELRARGGLLRVREFIMKDAYSFSTDEDQFKAEYKNMWETYLRIYRRLGLEPLVVEADNGYIGGEYCHEFQVESEIGEGKFFISEDGQYVAHEDVAKFVVEDKNTNEDLKEMQEVEAIRGNTMEDGVKLHGLPDWQQMKDVMFTDSEGKLYLAVIRGDLDVNKTKLEHVLNKVGQLDSATEEQIREIGSEPGFISPVGLEGKVFIITDKSVRTVRNFYGGSNKKNRDILNINIDRDFKADLEADIALAQDGFESTDNHGKLIEKRGIEVGNIFQLGYHYTTLMNNANYTDVDGEQKKYYMGCYGIGVGRTLATIVEKYHDDKGIIWPEEIAPYTVHLIGLNLEDEAVKNKAEAIYQVLQKMGVEVLFDDRTDTMAGEKFADSDLIGIPYRVVVSKRTGEGVELKLRNQKESKNISLEELVKTLK